MGVPPLASSSATERRPEMALAEGEVMFSVARWAEDLEVGRMVVVPGCSRSVEVMNHENFGMTFVTTGFTLRATVGLDLLTHLPPVAGAELAALVGVVVASAGDGAKTDVGKSGRYDRHLPEALPAEDQGGRALRASETRSGAVPGAETLDRRTADGTGGPRFLRIPLADDRLVGGGLVVMPVHVLRATGGGELTTSAKAWIRHARRLPCRTGGYKQ